MKTVKLLILLLIPAAMFFTSCENELPPEIFQIEENPDTAGDEDRYKVSDVDYFELSLYKLNPAEINVAGSNNLEEKVLPDMHLEKGEILRLEGLEPGYYWLRGDAYKINKNPNPDFDPSSDDPKDGPFILVGAVSGKSDRMQQFSNNRSYIIVEEYSPVIIKLVFTGERESY